MIYIFMPWAACGDLHQIMQSNGGKFSPPLVKLYAAQVCLALEHLHSYDLVYRDLKPENLFLMQNGSVKLGDFGFIKRLKGEERTYTLCGTP